METLRTKSSVERKLNNRIRRLNLKQQRALLKELDAAFEVDQLNKSVSKNNITRDEIVEIVREVRRKMYLENAR